MAENEYKIKYLTDMLELEDDQIDRICAELPTALKEAKKVITMLKIIGDQAGIDNVTEMLMPMTWIDDGKTDLTMRVQHEITQKGDDNE